MGDVIRGEALYRGNGKIRPLWATCHGKSLDFLPEAARNRESLYWLRLQPCALTNWSLWWNL